MKDFFSREYKKFDYDVIYNKLNNSVNCFTIESLSKKYIKSLLSKYDFNSFLNYRLYVLSQWIYYNEKYTNNFISRLDFIINNLFLNNLLNSSERQYIKNIESIVFTKNRNLKNIITDFPLEEKEIVYYKHLDLFFYSLIDDEKKIIEENAELYISNIRISIFKNFNVYSFFYSELKCYDFSKNGLTFYFKNGRKYFLSTENNFIFYVSLERIIKLEKLEL